VLVVLLVSHMLSPLVRLQFFFFVELLRPLRHAPPYLPLRLSLTSRPSAPMVISGNQSRVPRSAIIISYHINCHHYRWLDNPSIEVIIPSSPLPISHLSVPPPPDSPVAGGGVLSMVSLAINPACPPSSWWGPQQKSPPCRFQPGPHLPINPPPQFIHAWAEARFPSVASPDGMQGCLWT
jgi:hypothetical protein